MDENETRERGRSGAIAPMERPDINDMVEAGMPLWAAFELWSEMMSAPEMSIEHWWARVSSNSGRWN